MKFKVSLVVNIKVMVFWAVTSCSLVDSYHGGTCCRHHQGREVEKWERCEIHGRII
jgi:hypothetical protein